MPPSAGARTLNVPPPASTCHPARNDQSASYTWILPEGVCGTTCNPSGVETTPVAYPTGHSSELGSQLKPPAAESADPKKPAAPTTRRQLATIVSPRCQPLPRSDENGINAAPMMKVPPISTTRRMESTCIA